MTGVVWIVLPTVVFGALALTVPDSGPPPRWRALAARVGRRLRTVLPRRHRPSPPPPADPFVVLQLQLRLGVLAAQLRALEADSRVWGRAHRLSAAQAAYDALLAEACRMAGVDVLAAERRPTAVVPDEPERFREEMELASRGWSW